MSRKVRFTTLVVVISMLQACCSPIQEIGGHTSETIIKEIRFSLSEESPTKSSITPREGVIDNVAVYAYKGGCLEAFSQTDDAESLKMSLTVGETYNLYCIANVDEYPEIADEEEFVRYGIRVDMESMGDALPMSQSLTLTVTEDMREISLVLIRLVARLELVVEKGLLDYMEVVSVRLCQSAEVIRPFQENGSRVEDDTEAFTGDYASEADVMSLNSGGSMHLYALENCQGELLPFNDDPWKKVPEYIDDHIARCCTYLEIKCLFPESDEYGVYCGEVMYRFYLGDDAVSDFSLRRNTRQEIALFATEDGLGKISWRVDASNLVFKGGDVKGIFIENFHPADNLYVTEYAFFELEMDASADEFWSENGFEIVGLSKEGEMLMEFENLQYQGDGYYICTGKALKPGDFDVWLVNERGNKVLCVFEGGHIQLPRAVIGMGESYGGYDVVEPLDEDAECFINEDAFNIYVYLTDTDGYNLNQCTGCDCSMLDWRAVLVGNGCEIPDGCVVTGDVKFGVPADESFVAMIPLRVVNDGRSPDTNMSLSKVLGRGRTMLTVSEPSFSLSDTHQASVYAEDIVVELGTTYEIVNSSNLPFTIAGWKLFRAAGTDVSSYYNSAVQTVTGHVECLSLFTSGMQQWEGIYPLYMSRMPPVCCSWEESCPVSDAGITDDLLKSMIQADRRRLSDGSYQYRTVKDRYTMLSAEMMYECTCPPDIEVKTKAGFGTDVPVVDQLSMDPISVEMYFDENHCLVAVASEPVTLSVEVYGTLNSHIRTVSAHDLILGSLDIRYYKHSDGFTSGIHEVRLSESPVAVDNSAVRNVLDYIRTVEYYSKYDGIYAREVLKPYSMTLGVDIVTSSERAVSVRFPKRLLYRYENINYQYGEPPSTFNHRSKDVPDAEAFVDDDVSLVFNVTTRVLPEINLVTRL